MFVWKEIHVVHGKYIYVPGDGYYNNIQCSIIGCLYVLGLSH